MIPSKSVFAVRYGPPGAKSPRDQAREAVETGKRDRAFDKIANRSGILVAEDFTLEVQASPSSKP